MGAYIQRSYIWRQLQILNLTVNMPLQVAQDEEERNFAKWQLEVGHRKHTDKDGNIDIPEQFYCPRT
jgi:PIF1-like helicase